MFTLLWKPHVGLSRLSETRPSLPMSASPTPSAQVRGLDLRWAEGRGALTQAVTEAWTGWSLETPCCAVRWGGVQLFIPRGPPAGEGLSQLPWSRHLTYVVYRPGGLGEQCLHHGGFLTSDLTSAV